MALGLHAKVAGALKEMSSNPAVNGDYSYFQTGWF